MIRPASSASHFLHAGSAGTVYRPDAPRLTGGIGRSSGDLSNPVENGDAVGQPTFMRLGTILSHKGDELFIDFAPPGGVKGPLAYVFINGFSREIGKCMTRAVEDMRAFITVSARYAAKGIEYGHPDFPAEFQNKLDQYAKLGFTPKNFTEFYAYNDQSLRARGWKGEIPDASRLPRNTWDQLRDYEMGYPAALSNNETKRRFGALLGRPLLFAKGFLVTANRPEEAGQKGGRTVWTSLPLQIAIGLSIASLAVAASQSQSESSFDHIGSAS